MSKFNLQLNIGENIKGNMPMGYKNIMAFMTLAHKKKKITIQELEAFNNKCNIFFKEHDEKELKNNKSLYEEFKEYTGYNKLAL